MRVCATLLWTLWKTKTKQKIDSFDERFSIDGSCVENICFIQRLLLLLFFCYFIVSCSYPYANAHTHKYSFESTKVHKNGCLVLIQSAVYTRHSFRMCVCNNLYSTGWLIFFLLFLPFFCVVCYVLFWFLFLFLFQFIRLAHSSPIL